MSSSPVTLSSQYSRLEECLKALEATIPPQDAEPVLRRFLADAPAIVPQARFFSEAFAEVLYEFALRHYQQGESRVCMWRFIKRLTPQESDPNASDFPDPLDTMVRLYLYSEPLSDLTCIFVPVNDVEHIKSCLSWLKLYYDGALYPSSLLWLYALDSSHSSLFSEELVYLGRRMDSDDLSRIIEPDLSYPDAVLLKRYDAHQENYARLEGKLANDEFRQLFTYLRQEHRDRCLRHHTGNRDTQKDRAFYFGRWEKFEDILRFGVSDRPQPGSVSFSDMRASTEFLNTYGKSVYLAKIQQPFFEATQLISSRFGGRIDKFMGDNVMSVFLGGEDAPSADGGEPGTYRHLFAILELCNVLYDLIEAGNFVETRLGLRSSITYGDKILRSNLGNDFMRDFTVTGETVNLAARLEHMTVQELRLHNKMYFKDAIERFPEISQLVAVVGHPDDLNPETRSVIQRFTLFQNISSNLEFLEKARFDVRFNHACYRQLREYLLSLGCRPIQPDRSESFGYESFEVAGITLRFYFVFFNPKGFMEYERVWMLALSPQELRTLKTAAWRRGEAS